MRDIRKAIAEYNTMVENSQKYDFYALELREIWEISKEEGQGDLSTLISNALSFGFMVGYRAGMHDAKDKASGGSKAGRCAS